MTRRADTLWSRPLKTGPLRSLPKRSRAGATSGKAFPSVRTHQPGCRTGTAASTSLMTTRDRLAARRTELQAKEADIARLEPALRGLGVEAGLTAIEGLDCVRLAERFERRLYEIARAWETSRALETRFMEARRRLAEAQAESADAAAQLEDWRRRWRRAAAALGLETDASIEGAETALGVWDWALSDGDNHRDRMRRVVGMQRDMREFEVGAHALLQRCAPTAAGDMAPEYGRAPSARPSCSARAAQAKRHAAAEDEETARRALVEARARLDRAKETMATRAAWPPAGSDPAAR